MENKKDFLLIPAEWAETQPLARLACSPPPPLRVWLRWPSKPVAWPSRPIGRTRLSG
jgi:hypothetical protein